MTERLIVIGGDAAGMSAASQARRRRPADDLAILVFERSSFVSYSACGEPYFVAGYVEDLDDLVVVTPQQFGERDIDVHVRHEVTEIDLDRGRVTVVDHDSGQVESHGYDTLLYATGAVPTRPPIEGIDLEGVHEMQTLDDARRVRRLSEQGVASVVVVGGGYIGLEMAEAFHHLGVPTTVVTSGPAVLETTLDPDMGTLVTERMREIGIAVHTDMRVECINERDGRVTGVGCTDQDFPADLVILGLGTRPAVDLAEEAGIPLGESGGVWVNPRQETRLDGVWSAGDCAEATHRLTRRPVNIHLGTVANKQGRVAGINLGGGGATFPGVLGTAITKVCGLEISRTGLTELQAREAGLPFVTATVNSITAANYWPEAEEMTLKVLAEKGSGRLLGAQIVGRERSAKRIDVFAAALWNEMSADDMMDMDLSYAPPFSGVWDPALIGARKAWEAVAEAL